MSDVTEWAGEDDAGLHWVDGLAHEWQAELGDPHEDIYTLADGIPVAG